MAPWADLLYACDYQWWEATPEAAEFRGLKVTATEKSCRGRPWLHRVPYDSSAPGISLDPLVIHTGGNSGFQALNLSLHLAGPGRRILTGFDMSVENGVHWHGLHTGRLQNPSEDTVAGWIQKFRAAVPYVAMAGLEVVNCTPGSALDCFPMMTIEEALP